MKITKNQLRRIIRESIKEKEQFTNEGIFSGLTAMVAQKFGDIGDVEDPEEEKEKMGDAISRYITAVMKAAKDEDSDKDESEIKSGALEAVKSAIQEIVAAWEQGGE